MLPGLEVLCYQKGLDRLCLFTLEWRRLGSALWWFIKLRDMVGEICFPWKVSKISGHIFMRGRIFKWDLRANSSTVVGYLEWAVKGEWAGSGTTLNEWAGINPAAFSSTAFLEHLYQKDCRVSKRWLATISRLEIEQDPMGWSFEFSKFR